MNKRYFINCFSIACMVCLSICVAANCIQEHSSDIIVQKVTQARCEAITANYGQEATDLWLQALETGDFYQYRKKTGYWKSSITDPNVIGTGQNAGLVSLAGQTIESDVYIYMGPYATKDMFLAECNKRGYKYPEDIRRIWAEDYFFEQNPSANPDNWPKITEKQYLASLKQQPAAPANTAVDSLKNFTGNTAEFNAYYYYTNYPDLQSAIGADGAKLLQHYNQYGKAEKRVANKLLK